MTAQTDHDRIDPTTLAGAARTFARTGSLADGLPYDSEGFDASLTDGATVLRGILGPKHHGFTRALFDTASSLDVQVPGRGRVDARLFAVQVHASGGRRREVSSPEGLRRLEGAFARCGMAAPGAAYAFLPDPLTERTMATMTPGQARRIARSLAARAVPGFPGSAPGDLRGLPVPDARGEVGDTIVGVRVAAADDGLGLHGDWFSSLGAVMAYDPDIEAIWCGAVGSVEDEEGFPEVSLPTTFGAMACHGATGRVLSDLWDEASVTGQREGDAAGILHHAVAGPDAFFALALPDGRVLGPTVGPGHWSDTLRETLCMVMRVGAEVRHLDGDAFAAALRA